MVTTMAKRTAITPTREENYPEWYQEVVKAADMAEHSQVRGCMVIKPWGYGIWERIQFELDRKFKETGHQNAYFPIFIPLSFLEKEAEHVEGFAKECAVVTHHRLEKGEDGKLVPGGKLEEPLVVRPTSEMIIGDTFSRWVSSYRDLPLLINQWANVVRWEMRTRLFLRTTEFLWQEGHTVHATKEEAIEESKKMLGVYVDFCNDYLAMPVIPGRKTADERFPGAVETFTFEAMMQDKKALQAGTSHFLGQNFSKSCDIKFQTKDGSLEYGWTTSWGATTRLIGGMIMAHSDDDGLVLPPRIAHKHIVIIPIIHDESLKADVLAFAEKLKTDLQKEHFHEMPIQVELDDRDIRAGEKSWGWVKKGMPIRIEIGAREMNEGKVTVMRRDKAPKDKEFFAVDDFVEKSSGILQSIQDNIYKKAKSFLKENTHELNDEKEFYEFFSKKDGESGFASVYYNEEAGVHEKIQKDLGVTARCIPIDGKDKPGKCIFSGKPSNKRVIFAKSY